MKEGNSKMELGGRQPFLIYEKDQREQKDGGGRLIWSGPELGASQEKEVS